MATVTIRNLSDEVVEALKALARSNHRSMEAEAREALTRLAEVDGLTSPIEWAAERRVGALRWAVPAAEINAMIEANPPTEEQRRVADEWVEELRRNRDDDPLEDPLKDPWERHAAL